MKTWILAALWIGLPLTQVQSADHALSTAGSNVSAPFGTRPQPSMARGIDGAVNAAKVTVSGNPTPDIGQKISQAFLNLQAGEIKGAAVGTVYVPKGNYTFANTITIRVGTPKTGGYREMLACDAGAHLHYTGTKDALFAGNRATGGQEVNLQIIGCNITGTAAARNGMHFAGFYGIFLESNRVALFNNRKSPGAAGYFFDGAGVATCINNTATNDTFGVLLKSNQSTGTAANAIHWTGGLLQSDKAWGWLDAYEPGFHSESYGNSVEDVDFEGNGTPSTKSGDIAIENSLNTTVERNYEETDYGKDQILIDGSAVGVGLVRIIGNELDNPGADNANITVEGRVDNLDVEENNTAVAGAYFIDAATPAANIYAANNRISAPNAGNANYEYLRKQVATFTTTANVSDTVSARSIVGTGIHCSVQATNPVAAGLKGVYVPPNTERGLVTIYHSAEAGGTFAVYCATP